MNVHDFRFIDEALAFIDKRQARELDNVEVKPGDVLLNITGASVARCCMAPAHLTPARVNQHVAIIRPNPSEADGRYIQYFLTGSIGKQRLLSLAQGGATREALTKATIEDFEIPFPPIEEQRRIAGILSAYDDLIENCQRRIRILEEMARSLYREWFIHFRYPGHESTPLTDSLLGPIPQGWRAKRLDEVAYNYDRHRRPLSKMARATVQGEYPYYGAAKVFDFVNDYIFDGEYVLMAEDGSVITPDRKPVLQLVNEKFWPNNHTHILQGCGVVSTHFLFLALGEIDVSPYITGAAQPKINQANMNRILFACADEALHARFDLLIKPMLGEWHVLKHMERNLCLTRDLLLPKLLQAPNARS
jgi:type I restriction enzyme S subunit